MKEPYRLVTFLLLALACGAYGAVQTPPGPGATAATSPPTNSQAIKVDVNLVLVEASVLDARGQAVGDLRREDFHVYENGVEQQIRTFSHEELPLAVALVIDNSSSVEAALNDLRNGALETLGVLKPDDKIALFSFAMQPELVEGLTADRQALAEDLWALSPNGGTDINDALYAAATYLGRTSADRRHAAILVSDNEPSETGTHGVRDVVRAALDSGTPIYSIKVGYMEHSKWFFLTHPETPLHDVEKICQESGGQLIDLRRGILVTTAMKTILTWLKQGYTLGYSPTNLRQDGSYRSLEVRVGARGKSKYTVYARQGYYAPVGK